MVDCSIVLAKKQNNKNNYILWHALEYYYVIKFNQQTRPMNTHRDLLVDCIQRRPRNPFDSRPTPPRSPSGARGETNPEDRTGKPPQHSACISCYEEQPGLDLLPPARDERRQITLALLKGGTLAVAIGCESRSNSDHKNIDIKVKLCYQKARTSR
jgi:hypothetical protein